MHNTITSQIFCSLETAKAIDELLPFKGKRVEVLSISHQRYSAGLGWILSLWLKIDGNAGVFKVHTLNGDMVPTSDEGRENAILYALDCNTPDLYLLSQQAPKL